MSPTAFGFFRRIWGKHFNDEYDQTKINPAN